jgi:hypothetical protein
MPKGPQGQKRPADTVANAIRVAHRGPSARYGNSGPGFIRAGTGHTTALTASVGPIQSLWRLC